MEYFLIFSLQLIGIGFHVAQKIKSLDAKYPDKSIRQIFNTFLDQDWVTLFISGLVIILDLVVHYILDSYTPELRKGVNYYVLYAFGIALVLGYAGQRIIYKWLGRAEEILDKQSDKLK
jgi:hypothetical protein